MMNLVNTLHILASHVPQVLLMYWVLAAGSVIVTILPVPLPASFKDAVRLSACRGKLWDGKPAALGPLKDWSVPQAWFLHFYLIGSCCNALVLLLFCGSLGSNSSSGHIKYNLSTPEVQSLLVLAFFQLHLVRRALETSYVLKYPPQAVMHGIAYLFGMTYYCVVPLSLLPSSWYEQQQWKQLHGWQQAVHHLTMSLHTLPAQLSGLQLLGAAVFLAGNVIQFAAHRGLAALAPGPKDLASGKATYKIPRGGLFELVSSPHYMAEIVIYCGLLLMTEGSLLPLLMLTWVGFNLVLAAQATHSWYIKHFDAYPARRKVLVPYVY